MLNYLKQLLDSNGSRKWNPSHVNLFISFWTVYTEYRQHFIKTIKLDVEKIIFKF